MTPRAVVFDLGKVLVDFDYRIAARRFAARADCAADKIQPLIQNSPLLYQFETGLLTNQQFYEAVRHATGFRGDFAEFAQIFADIFWPVTPMVEWQARLRRAGVPTFIFSNTNELAISHIRRSFPFFTGFDGYIYSYQQGAMKPAPAIYEALERLAHRAGPELLYIDDRLENIQGAEARCWQVILHENAQKTLERAHALLNAR